MGRPPLVDRDEALDQIMRKFWEQGFAATSLDDLLAATSTHKGSFYRLFGSKRSSFDAAFDRYVELVTTSDIFPVLTSDASPAERLEQLVLKRLDSTLVPGSGSGHRPRGCLVVNTATELAAHDDSAAARTRAALYALRDVVASLIREACDAGQADESVDDTSAADRLVALLQGAIVLGRAGYPPDHLRQTVTDAVHATLNAGL